MNKQRIYDLVKELLTDYPELRDSDKKLIWKVWFNLGLVVFGDQPMFIRFDNFMKAPSTESIRRCRQKIQEHFPELRGSKAVQKARAEKAEENGTFIFRETIGVQEKFV